MVAKTNSKLKFAALIRVSTEHQEKKGESLAVQKEQIEQAVEFWGGKIAEWYGGQEHATEGFEKLQIQRLLADAKRKKFNAIIVAHPDRWSRDNAQHAEGIKILKNAGVRFFVLGSEHDLRNPTDIFMLDISTVIGSYNAALSNDKSQSSRIRRAKRGVPCSGSLPYGRTFDKKTETWGIDPDKQRIIKDCATRYIKGEMLEDLAIKYDMNQSALHRTLTTRCGSVHEQTFNYRGKVITTKTKMPRLLPEDTIKAIHKRAAANKTYHHGIIKNFYLLNRMIFCGHCGYALNGSTAEAKTTKVKYASYRHTREERKNPCHRPKAKSHAIRTKNIEPLVMEHLFRMFGDPATVQRAIEKATPNLKKLQQDRRRIEAIEKDLKKIQAGRDRILKLIIDDVLSEDEAKDRLTKLKDRKTLLTEEMDRLLDNQSGQPTTEQIRAISKKVSEQFKRSVRVGTARRRSTSQAWFKKMTEKDKKALCELIFSGTTLDGRRMGVYIHWDGKGGWAYDIHGHLIDREGLLPNSKGIDDEDDIGSKQKELLTKSTSERTGIYTNATEGK